MFLTQRVNYLTCKSPKDSHGQCPRDCIDAHFTFQTCHLLLLLFLSAMKKGKKCFMAISQLLISFHLIFNFLQTCSLLFIHKKNLPSAFTRHIQNNGCCFFSLFLSFPLVMKLMSLSVVEGESRLSAEEMLTTMNYISSVLLQALNSQDSRGRCKIEPPGGGDNNYLKQKYSNKQMLRLSTLSEVLNIFFE